MSESPDYGEINNAPIMTGTINYNRLYDVNGFTLNSTEGTKSMIAYQNAALKTEEYPLIKAEEEPSINYCPPAIGFMSP